MIKPEIMFSRDGYTVGQKVIVDERIQKTEATITEITHNTITLTDSAGVSRVVVA